MYRVAIFAVRIQQFFNWKKKAKFPTQSWSLLKDTYLMCFETVKCSVCRNNSNCLFLSHLTAYCLAKCYNVFIFILEIDQIVVQNGNNKYNLSSD